MSAKEANNISSEARTAPSTGNDQIGRESRAPRFEPIEFKPAEIFATGFDGPPPNYLGTSASSYFAEKYSQAFFSKPNEFFSSVSVGATGQFGLVIIGLGPYIGSSVSFGFNAAGDGVIQLQTVYGVGLGTYVGAGVGFQMGTGAPPIEGRQTGLQAELNFGWGAASGGQVQIADGGWGIGSGIGQLLGSLSTRAMRLKDGVGFGAHVSVGITNTRTIIIQRQNLNPAKFGRSVNSGHVRLREWSRSGGAR